MISPTATSANPMIISNFPSPLKSLSLVTSHTRTVPAESLWRQQSGTVATYDKQEVTNLIVPSLLNWLPLVFHIRTFFLEPPLHIVEFLRRQNTAVPVGKRS